jgi:hypothetical protein
MRVSTEQCVIEGCFKNQEIAEYCAKHYSRVYEGKDPLQRTKYDKNNFIDCGSFFRIEMSKKGGGASVSAVIDREDYNRCVGFKWFLTSAGYVFNGKQKIFLHRFILDAKDGSVVDHRDRDPLNNRRDNLRICPGENHSHWNTKNHKDGATGLKGVWYRKERDRYVARIYHNGRSYWLGSYATKNEAARAYDTAAEKRFGDFGYLNSENMGGL